MVQNTSANTFGTAKWIVSSNAYDGTHTTIASALTSASSGDTIFIRTGTYTEDLTLKAGVNLAAYSCDSKDGNVIILGKCSATFAGQCSLTGLRLKTNSDFCLAVTGSSATIVRLVDCWIDVNNNTAISFTSSSGSSFIWLENCRGDTATTGIAYFSHSGAGTIKFVGGIYENNASASTACTVSGSGAVNFYNCYFANPITTSSTANFVAENSQLVPNGSITLGGTGSNNLDGCQISSGSNSAISVGTGATATVDLCRIDSTNTNAITGAGTLKYYGLAFTNSSSKINTTTQTGGTLQGGLTQAPSAGFLGEQIRGQANSVAMSSGTAKTITSISVTAGIWDICAVVVLSAGAQTACSMGISTTNNTLPTGSALGDNLVQFNSLTSGLNPSSLTIAGYRVTLTAKTTYYLVASQTVASGSPVGDGRISATRVG
jgi:hypothetical protein